MKLLKKSDYNKLESLLKNSKINTLFARSVVEGKVDGEIFTASVSNPKTFYIKHPYGMSLLCGVIIDNHFLQEFEEYICSEQRVGKDLMQVYPNLLNHKLKEFFSKPHIDIIIDKSQRINFKFSKQNYSKLRAELNLDELDIRLVDDVIFNQMSGVVVPLKFWDNSETFIKNGIGFSLSEEGELACTAFSAFIFEHELELGMETIEKFRGEGMAVKTCAKLIDYCLDNNYEPIWACKFDNIGSLKLALKLGFEVDKELPYYIF
jgi:hypothetical protein